MKEDKRVIKFRAFIEDYGEMYSVISVFRKSVNEDFQRIFIDKEAAEGHPANYRVGDGVHLMQFTGEVDKNGDEIYDGDIVKRIVDDFSVEDFPYGDKPTPTKEEISFIEYHSAGFWVHDESFGWEGEDLWNWKDIEVIGNKFEHASLLTPPTSKQGNE